MKFAPSFENTTTQLIVGTLGLVGIMALSVSMQSPSWPLTLGLAAISTIILARFLAILGIPMLLSGFLASAFWVALDFPTPDIWAVFTPLAMSFFGLVIGTRLHLEHIKKQGPGLALMSVVLGLAIMASVGLSYVVLDHTFRLGIEAFSPEHRLLYAVGFGYLALFGAPIITLAVCQQRGIWGNLAQATLLISALLPIFGALLYPFFAAWAFEILEIQTPVTGSWTVLWRTLGLGLVLAALARLLGKIGERAQAPALAALFALGSWFAVQYDAIGFLAFIPAGIVLKHLPRTELAAHIQEWTTPSTLLFFLVLGLSMGLVIDESTLVIALALTVGRAAGISLIVGRIAAYIPRFSQAEVRRTLYSTGTLAVFFATDLSHAAPFFVPVANITAWVVLASAFFGAVTLDAALMRTGEDTQQVEEDEKLEELIPIEAVERGWWLDSRGFRDRWLSGRVRELRNVMLEAHKPIFEAVQTEYTVVIKSVDELEERVAKLSALLEEDLSDSERTLRINKIIQNFRQMDLDASAKASIEPTILRRLDEALAAAESENRSLKVELEDAFYQAPLNASFSHRALVMLRKIRRMVVGDTVRNVPLGRIWHYEIRLGMPNTLKFPILRTTRRIATTWQHIAELTRDASSLLVDIQTYWEQEANDEVLESLKVRSREVLADLDLTREMLEKSSDQNIRECATRGSENFDRFLFAVARAGTLEWPAFRFRLSARFDQAARQLSSTERQITRNVSLRDASIGQTMLWLTRLRFDEWYLDFLTQVGQSVQRNLQPNIYLDKLKQYSDADGPSLNSLLQNTADVLRVRSARFAENDVTADVLRRLERRVAGLPKELRVLGPQRQPQVVAVRDAVQNEILREVALVLLEGNELAEQLLRRTHAKITELRQDIATNANEESRSAALNALVDKHRAESEELVVDLKKRLRERCVGLVERVVKRPTFWRRADPTTQRARALYEKFRDYTRPAVRRLLVQFESRLNVPDDAESRVHIHDWNQHFHERMNALPAMYRRLFDTNVVDIADFYVERPSQENQLLMALQEPDLSILVHGNQGVGKTSLVHHVLDRSELGNLRRVSQIRLVRGMSDQEILQELAQALKLTEGKDVEREVSKITDRPIVILENADEFFWRTLNGFRRFSRLLDFISRTSPRISWIVVMRTPTVVMLDTCLGLKDYFSHVLEIPNFSAEGLRELIMKRHRASGYAVDFGEERFWNRWFGKTPKDVVFEDLWSQSNGNPLLGQLLWLSALERKNERTLTIEHIKAQPRHMTRSCQVDQQHILAALIRHRSMSVEELHQVLRISRSAIQRELNHLMRLGLVRLHLDLADRFEVSSLFSMTLEHELREENVL